MSLADLDHEVGAFIAKSEAFYPASANEATPAENRAIYDRMCAAFDQPRPPGLAVTDETLRATDPTRALPIRRYLPAGAPAGRLVLYFHGGGFVVGGLHSHDGLCAELAAASERQLVALDYRLAPEHLYPAALDDAEAAYLALYATMPRIVLAGDSAGGNLAAALCLRLRRKGLPLPVGQVLIYPGLHPKAGRAAGTWRAEVPMLRASDILVYRRLYTGQGRRRHGGRGTRAPRREGLRRAAASGYLRGRYRSAGGGRGGLRGRSHRRRGRRNPRPRYRPGSRLPARSPWKHAHFAELRGDRGSLALARRIGELPRREGATAMHAYVAIQLCD